jgi:PAS domain S-box-containing protein
MLRDVAQPGEHRPPLTPDEGKRIAEQWERALGARRRPAERRDTDADERDRIADEREVKADLRDADVGDSALAGAGDALRRLAESGLIAVVAATRDKITEANGAFLRLVGYSRADLAGGLDWQAITPPEWAAADQVALAELEATGSCVPFRKEYWHKDGSRVPVEISAVELAREPLRWACFIRDVSAEQRAEAVAQRVAELAALTAALAQAATVAEVARALTAHLRQAVDANLATIIEAVPRRAVLRFVDLQGVPEELYREWGEFDASLDSPAVRAWRGGEPVFFGDPEALDAEFPHLAAIRADTGTGSCLAAPLITAGKVTGVLAVTWAEPRQHGPVQQQFLAAVAGYAAQALERARLYDAEYTVAHQLQRSLLPQLPGALPGVSIGTAYRPAEQGHDVGGDWYDAFELPGGKIGCAAGDVVGHDMHAAIAMGRLQLLLRHAAFSGADPAGVLAALDAACPALTGTDFATIAYAEYDPAAQTLTYACAGHPPPLLANGTTVTYLDGGRSAVAGMGGPWSQATLKVPHGSMLVLYTDGLVERRGEPIDVGFSQLATAAAGLPGADAQPWCDGLLRVMTHGRVLADDVAVVCMKLNGLPSGT